MLSDASPYAAASHAVPVLPIDEAFRPQASRRPIIAWICWSLHACTRATFCASNAVPTIVAGLVQIGWYYGAARLVPCSGYR